MGRNTGFWVCAPLPPVSFQGKPVLALQQPHYRLVTVFDNQHVESKVVKVALPAGLKEDRFKELRFGTYLHTLELFFGYAARNRGKAPARAKRPLLPCRAPEQRKMADTV